MGPLFRKYRLSHALAAVTVAATAFALVPVDSASAAYTFKRLHSFCGQSSCPDGVGLVAGLVVDPSGNLYGTAPNGGKYNEGVVFRLTPNSDKSRYTETVLHNFCRPYKGCLDGYGPATEVILDVDGNIYGTSQYGGNRGYGLVFKLTHGSKGWALSVVKNFCEESKCADGAYPGTGLSYAGQDSGKAWDEKSPLFGTTDKGGDYHHGVDYELTPNGSNWSFGRIHNFQSGAYPQGVLVDSAGNIWGTTQSGGKYGAGVMYRLASGTWSETTLHNFCNTQNCADGNGPVGRLAMDASGNLFGATIEGGSNSNTQMCGSTCGVVFERTSGGTYGVVYNFCSLTNCDDGAIPLAGVIIDSSGALFGTTGYGGTGEFADSYNGGTVYELSGGTESVLYSFCSQSVCADGDGPNAVMLDSSGEFFGTTTSGGTYDAGTAFRLGP